MAPVWTTKLEQYDDSEQTYIRIPEELWDKDMLADHDRFDMLLRPDGSVLLRPCELDSDKQVVDSTNPHPNDADWSDQSICGLIKWTCAHCGAGTIVEHGKAWPHGWVAAVSRDVDGATLGEDAYCSLACLADGVAVLAAQGADLLK